MWAADFQVLGRLIGQAVPGQVLAIRHVGSTAVARLMAKPVIDIDLIVPDVEDEGSYLPELRDAGLRLIFRDTFAGDVHRQLTCANPNANIHVWNADAIEPRRHLLFVDWLQANERDREFYNETKRLAVAATGSHRYNDLKAAAVYDIYERAFIADPNHHHDPQPRE